MNRKQSGVSMMGFLMLLIVVGVFAALAMKTIPMYLEFMSAKKILKATVDNNTARDLPTLRADFMKRLGIEVNSTVIKPENLNLNAGKLELSYENRTPLVANFDIVGKFQDAQPVGGGGVE